MKVAIDTGSLTSGHAVRGIGVHTRELVNGLKNLQNKSFQIDSFDFKSERLKLETEKYDLIHYPYFHPFFITLPFQKLAKKVIVTIHDLIPLIYPDHYPPGLKGSVNLFIQKFLLRNIDGVITISETSKKDICRFLGIPPNKVHVIYLAPLKTYKPEKDIEKVNRVKKKFNLPNKFVFYFGDINYNKNIPNLVKACELLNLKLVIGGKQAKDLESMDLTHPENSHLKEIFNDLVDVKKVLRLGYISDEEASTIYNTASVCVQPSFYEGFGLSVVNAFAAGCPVVAAKTQTLVEIGEEASLFADPKDVNDLKEKISIVLSDNVLRNQLIETGKVLVKRYSWGKTAEETLEVYRSV